MNTELKRAKVEIEPESSSWTRSLSPKLRESIRSLYTLRPWTNAICLLFPLLWAGTAWTMSLTDATWVQAAGIVLIGACIHAMAILMHEGIHGNLFRIRVLDRWVGFALGAPALFSAAAYRVNHLLHHRHNRTSQDPDEFTNLTSNRFLLQGAFFAWPFVGMTAYLVHVPVSAIRRGTRAQRRDVILELALMALLYGSAIATCWMTGTLRELMLFWVAPLGAAAAFGAFRGWSEHTMTRAGHPLTQSRTVVSNVIVSFFMCNLNYHLEHHLFPGVPWYNLPRLHTLLRPEYEEAGAFIYRSYVRFVWDAIRTGVHGEAPEAGRRSGRVIGT